MPIKIPSPGHRWVVQDVLNFANQEDKQCYPLNLHFPEDWYVEHYFICLLCIWISSFVKYTFKNFVYFSTGLISILLTCRSLPCILDSSILLVLCDMNTFSLSVPCLFILFIIFLVWSNISNFSSVTTLFLLFFF